MFDLEQLRKDLRDLLAGKFGDRWSMRAAGAGSVGFGKIQRFLSHTNKRSPNVEDIAAMLESCDTSLAIYLIRINMLRELDTLNEDAELIEKFKRALKVPEKRKMLKPFLDGLVPDEPQFDKSTKGPRGRHASHKAGRNGE